MVTDHLQRCVKQVNRSTGQDEIFFGQCSDREMRPRDIIYIEEQNVFYYLYDDPGAILRHDPSNSE